MIPCNNEWLSTINYPYMYLYGYTETRSIKVYAKC